MKKYKEGISITDAELAVEQLDLDVEQALNTLQQGILSVKSQAIKHSSPVKEGEVNIRKAERVLEESKYKNPLNIQQILDNRSHLESCKQKLNVLIDNATFYNENLIYLENLEKELF